MEPRLRCPRTGAIALLALLAITSACTRSTPSTASTSTGGTGTSAPSTSRRVPKASIAWHDCDNSPPTFHCATIQVPLDHAKPDGPKISLALVKRSATGSSGTAEPLLVNPGGPGGSGIDFVEHNLWSRALSDHFDIIGFDPRGVGESSPINCGFDVGKLYSPDPAPRTPQGVAALEDVSKAYVASCAEHAASMLPHMGTRDVADDMDDIRVALGVDKINYLGYSYGTAIGQVYADRHPTHIRAMVLDGVVRLGQSGLDAARDQGTAFDKVLTQFFAQCKNLVGCPDDPRAAFLQVQDRLRDGTIPSTGMDRPLTSGAFQLGVGQALYSPRLWDPLAFGLANAAQGNGGTILMLSDEYLGRQGDGTYSNQTDVYFAVSCLDWDWPKDPQAVLDAAAAVAKTSPYLAEGIVTDYIRCAYWPVAPDPLTPPKAKGSPLIVVVSTTDDPATPYSNGVDLAKQLPRAALITKVGSQHTAYGSGNACVDNAVEAYLVSLRPPVAGLRCS
ncbi:MAG: alpha/beta fold hydrolase [Actinobacteria bacterium]|nr:alpha/beta fold hydrolase [Actinomycetota bacterium]